MGSKIEMIEYVYPKKRISNIDLGIEFPDYDFDKFQKKVGIGYRYVVEKNQTALDLAVEAVEKLFKEKYNKKDVDFILYCTQSPEYILPTTACVLQDRCGFSKNTGALDFNLGCSGYTYGLSLAKGLIEACQARNILLVTAETYSKYIHPKDKTNRAIFSDAATATLVTYSEDNMVDDFLFGSNGAGADKLIIKNGASKPSISSPVLKSYGSDNFYTDNNLYMNGPEIFNFTSSSIPKFTKQVLDKNKLLVSDVNQFIFHQANAFMLNFLRKRIKAEEENFYVNLLNGNSVSNTIPIALKEYSNSKIILQKETLLLMGFGVGLSWSGGIISLNKNI